MKMVASRNKEFLITGGDGSFSLISLNWENRRKYHGFLIKSGSPPAKRFVVFSGIKEYIDGKPVAPDTFEYPNRFITTRPKITRAVHLDSGVMVSYEVRSGQRLVLRPYFNYRHMYDVRSEPGDGNVKVTSKGFSVSIDGNQIDVGLHGKYKFVPEPKWEMFEYEIDMERGESFRDYNFSPGAIEVMGNFGITVPASARPKSADQSFEINATIARENNRFVIAGYPWFSFWTRDAMIYTRYLVSAGRFNEARQILESVYRLRREDVLPEFIDDRTGQPVYSGLDGNLLFLSVLGEYIEKSNDWEILSMMDPEALIMPAIGNLDGNLFLDTKTWTDTIERRKPVEIQAFLFNSLISVSKMIESDDSARYESLAAELRKTFRKEYVDSQGIKDSDNDVRVRPNFLFTAYFPHKIVSPQKLRKSMKLVLSDLITPFGLRTLGSGEPGYFGIYQRSRPESYHNGTVWSWLVGPLFEAVKYAYPSMMDEVRQIVDSLEKHRWSQGVIGQINEIFDGDAPHRARGCPAQAWSFSEIERVKLLGSFDSRPGS
uniref:Glycogen debranching enzyme n=1 Tax=uncultured euryarchaeote Alv-FOS5 TaxID=337891 RepID=Q3SB94_9EURY|nr:glycogen debranching enzyme [uncultured euryarchaeote Alv-FOS5]